MGKWKGVIILLVAAALVLWGLLNLPKIINAVQGRYTAWKQYRQIEALEKPYKTDKIGGQTPEETFDLFISALKKEDIELASKYFVLQKQDEWQKSFSKLRENSNYYNAMISELEFARENHNKKVINVDNVSFIYKVNNNLGMGVEIIFEKYPTGVWKINLL